MFVLVFCEMSINVSALNKGSYDINTLQIVASFKKRKKCNIYGFCLRLEGNVYNFLGSSWIHL